MSAPSRYTRDEWEVTEFADAEHFWETARTRQDPSTNWDQWGDDFAGAANLQAANELALSWPEGMERARKLSDKISAKIGGMINRPLPVYTVTGEYFDVARVIEGAPESWIDDEDNLEQAPGKLYRIGINISASSAVTKETMLIRASVVAALVDALGKTGRTAEVMGLEAVIGRSDSKKHVTYFPIKRTDEPLSLDRLAYMSGHPAMLRKHVLNTNDSEPMAIREEFGFGHGRNNYGRPCDIDADERKAYDVYFPKMASWEEHYHSEEAAYKHTLDILRQLGLLDDETRQPGSRPPDRDPSPDPGPSKTTKGLAGALMGNRREIKLKNCQTKTVVGGAGGKRLTLNTGIDAHSGLKVKAWGSLSNWQDGAEMTVRVTAKKPGKEITVKPE